jgi:hypothetical protein
MAGMIMTAWPVEDYDRVQMFMFEVRAVLS